MSGMELLQNKIDLSGLQQVCVAEKCGLSDQGLKNKLKGDAEFTVSEIAVLKRLLYLTDAEVQTFFLNDEVD